MPTEHNLLIKAKEAVENNQLIQAGEYLDELLIENPLHEEGWLLAAEIVSDPNKRMQYANNILAFNPENIEARRLATSIPEEILFDHRQQITADWLTYLLPALIVVAVIGLFIFPSTSNSTLSLATPTSTPIPTATPHLIDRGAFERGQSIPIAPELHQVDELEARSPSISADGEFVTFEATSPDKVANIYLFNANTGETELVSKSFDGTESNGNSTQPSISANGRYIVFQSKASNLIENDTNADKDVFVYSRENKTIKIVSVSSLGIQNKNSIANMSPSISGDGQLITFASKNDRLVINDTNVRSDIFVHDQISQQTYRVSVGPEGMEGDNDSYNPSISSNGEFIVFTSEATNLITNTVLPQSQIYLHEIKTKSTELVTLSNQKRSSGSGGNSHSDNAVISHDGNVIAFSSFSDNLTLNDDNSHLDVFIFNRNSGTIVLASKVFNIYDTERFKPSNFEIHLSLSADGRYLIFGQSSNHRIVNRPQAEIQDIFVYDQLTQKSSHIAFSLGTLRAGKRLYDPTISAGGQFLVFASNNNGLSDSGLNRGVGIFLRPLELNN